MYYISIVLYQYIKIGIETVNVRVQKAYGLTSVICLFGNNAPLLKSIILFLFMSEILIFCSFEYFIFFYSKSLNPP